ncbi:sharpin, partial [Athene cunicularia]|uniref:sharpin n=1 Tax=Athene cunicularia TaxID=194338 RepID=UPI000EF69D57
MWVLRTPGSCSQNVAAYDLKDISYKVKSPTCHELTVLSSSDEPLVFDFEEEREAQKWWTIVSSSLREVQKAAESSLAAQASALPAAAGASSADQDPEAALSLELSEKGKGRDGQRRETLLLGELEGFRLCAGGEAAVGLGAGADMGNVYSHGPGDSGELGSTRCRARKRQKVEIAVEAAGKRLEQRMNKMGGNKFPVRVKCGVRGVGWELQAGHRLGGSVPVSRDMMVVGNSVSDLLGLPCGASALALRVESIVPGERPVPVARPVPPIPASPSNGLALSSSMKVGVEDATSSASITLRVRAHTTIAALKQQVFQDYGFHPLVQRWIIGQCLCVDERTVSSYGIRRDGDMAFLYLLSAKMAELTEQRYEEDQAQVMLSSTSLLSNDDAERHKYNTLPNMSPKKGWGNEPSRKMDIGEISQHLDALQMGDLSGQSQPMATSLPSPVQAGWSCPKCTFINKPTRPGCEMCSADRPD